MVLHHRCIYSVSVLSRSCKNVVYTVDISSIGLLWQMANKTKELKLNVRPFMAFAVKIKVFKSSSRKPFIHNIFM